MTCPRPPHQHPNAYPVSWPWTALNASKGLSSKLNRWGDLSSHQHSTPTWGKYLEDQGTNSLAQQHRRATHLDHGCNRQKEGLALDASKGIVFFEANGATVFLLLFPLTHTHTQKKGYHQKKAHPNVSIMVSPKRPFDRLVWATK